MSHRQKQFYDPCNVKYGAMTKYDDGDDDRDNDGNEYGNNNDNDTDGSGSDGLIFYLITKPQSSGGGSIKNGDGAVDVVHYVSMRRTIYLPYKDHIKDVP